jgi:hypothetical protein
MDEVGKVLQSLESNTTIDTSSPVINEGVSKQLTQTDIELELEKQIKKELPEEEKDIEIVTPDGEPDYIPPAGGGGYGGGGPIGNPEDGGLGRPNLADGGMGRERMEFQ